MTGFVRRSINGGESWRAAFYPMSGERLAAVGVAAGSGVLWIVSDEAAWVSPDAGSSWTRTGIVPMGAVKDAVFADSSLGWLVSSAGIVQRLERNPLLSTRPPQARPSAGLSISGIYPQPASGEEAAVSVEYVVGRARPIRLSVFNSAGVEVAVLESGARGPGRYHAVFDRAGLPSGVYFISLASGTDQVVRRMMLTR